MKAMAVLVSKSRALIPVALGICVLFSALAVVRIKHENRALVNDLEQLRREHARLEMEWAQLQLEEATLSHHARVEKIAREQLGMTEPRDYVVVERAAP